MDLTDKRYLIAGATGVLGGLLAHELAGHGVRLVLAGRNPETLSRIGGELGVPTAPLDFTDPSSPRRCLEQAVAALGGLDGLLIVTGAVAFGEVHDGADDDVVRELFAVNALGPIALIQAAVSRPDAPEAIAAVTAVVADHPTVGLAAYSASKAALSAYLTALRREQRRRGAVVLDVRPQHMDTGFAQRALAGEPGHLPAPGDHRAVAGQIVTALLEERSELAYDLESKALVAR